MNSTLSELVAGKPQEPTPVSVGLQNRSIHCERVWVNWQAILDLFYPRVSANKQARFKAAHRRTKGSNYV